MIKGSALDTLVVDRRTAGRNPAVSRAVKAQRRRLVAEGTPDGISAGQLIAQMGERAISHAFMMLVLVAMIATLGALVLRTAEPLLWGAVTSAIYLLFAMVLRRLSAREKPPSEALVQLAHLPLGVSWAWFTAIECGPDCAGWAAAVFRADALLVAMATAALVHANVRAAVMIVFLPAIIVLTARTSAGEVMDLSMLAMAMIGLAFFTFVAVRLRAANLETLQLAREKDALIAELETEKAVSDTARHRAEEANLAKTRFLASMSHELRTPLNAIMGFSEVMRDEILGPIENETYAGYVRDIHRSGRHLLSLINEILDLSRVEAGRYPMEFRPLALTEIARTAIETLRVKAGQKGLVVTTRFEEGLRPALVDERAMSQTLLNLVSNAIKFTPRNGSIEISVGRTAGGGQYVTVSDNGPGIPEEELPLVLSAFGQGSIALKNAEEGTGLGLAIVQALVAKHDGRFLLASELRKGTRATVILPAARVVDPAAKNVAAGAAAGVVAPGTGAPRTAAPDAGAEARAEGLARAG